MNCEHIICLKYLLRNLFVLVEFKIFRLSENLYIICATSIKKNNIFRTNNTINIKITIYNSSSNFNFTNKHSRITEQILYEISRRK